MIGKGIHLLHSYFKINSSYLLRNWGTHRQKWRFPGDSANVGDMGSIPVSGRSSGEGNGNLLQYFCLGNLIDRGAWQATILRTAKSWMQSTNQAYTQRQKFKTACFFFLSMESTKTETGKMFYAQPVTVFHSIFYILKGFGGKSHYLKCKMLTYYLTNHFVLLLFLLTLYPSKLLLLKVACTIKFL